MGLAVQFSTLVELFEEITAKFGNDPRPLLQYKAGGRYTGITVRDFRAFVEDLSCGFHLAGMKGGDAAAIIAENRPEWVMVDQALLRLGVVTVPIYTTLPPKQIGFILKDAGVQYVIVSNQFQLSKVQKIAGEIRTLKAIFTMAEKIQDEQPGVQTLAAIRKAGTERRDLQERIREEARRIMPEDLLTLIYTSGTMGAPKGVMLTHKNIVRNICSAVPCFPIGHDDTLLSYLPLSHTFERLVYYVALACGATVAYAESVDTLPENMIDVRPTIITSVPRLFERMHNRVMKKVESASVLQQRMFAWALSIGYAFCEARRRGRQPAMLGIKRRLADRMIFRAIRERTGGRIRFFVSGGAALPAELGRFFEAIGLLIIEGYGLTEASPVISVNKIDDYKFGTIGKTIPGVEVKIAPDGEILARGDNVMKGYWKNPGGTQDVIDASGWLHTGDIGLYDHDGFLIITDRKKHIFVNSGGKNIAPQHVEGLFTQSPYIDQFVLIGDRRMFCTALIVPEFGAVRDFFRREQITVSSEKELVVHPAVQKLFGTEINKVQKDLANFERVRKFTLLSQPFTIESGELTPSMKIKRQVVEEKYREVIEKMYEGIV